MVVAFDVRPAVFLETLRLSHEKIYLAFEKIGGRKKVLTSYGRMLYQTLKHEFSGIQSKVDHTNFIFSDARHAQLRIGGRRDVLQSYSDRIKFTRCLEFLYTDDVGAVDALLQGKVDIVLTQRLPISADIVAKPLFKNNFSLIIPKSLSK